MAGEDVAGASSSVAPALGPAVPDVPVGLLGEVLGAVVPGLVEVGAGVVDGLSDVREGVGVGVGAGSSEGSGVVVGTGTTGTTGASTSLLPPAGSVPVPVPVSSGRTPR